MKKLKKPISLILTIVLILSTLIAGGFSSFAAELPTIYSDVINASAGNTVEIPIYIKNNSGLLGWNLIFKYDSSVLKPVSISNGSSWNGTLSETITGDYAKDGEFEALYQQGTMNNNTSNGIIMYAVFEVNSAATGSTDITVDFNQENTYNCDFEDVELVCENIRVNILNTSTVIAFNSKEITAGEYVDIPLSIINANSLSAINITLDYDNENFEYIDFESVSSVNASVSENTGQIKISISNISFDIDNAVILKFKSSDFAYARQYEFSAINDNAIGSDNVIIRNSVVNVIASENSNSVVISSDDGLKGDFGETITIPFYMNHNKGLICYGLILSYDNKYLKPVSIEIANGFGGQIIDNIGRYSDHIDIMWNTVDETAKNGDFMLAKFEVVSEIEDVSTLINVDYSQENTANHAYEDVKFICNNVSILLNHIPVVTDITLKSKPSKLTYELFEEFDATGMIIEATKDDGSVETITDYTVTGFETNSVGTKTVTVSYADKSVSFDIEVAHNHTWGEWQTVSSPNCIDKGSEKRICSVCNEPEMRDVDPLGHNWDKDFTVDTEPKCETAGSKSIHCSRCDVIKDITSIDPIGHDYESSITKAATCTEDGIKTFVCKNDASHTYTEPIEKLGHNYVASITKQPTCEERGIKTFVCSNDSTHTYTEDLNPTGHDFELTKTIKPTCTEAGKETYTCKNDSSHTKEVVLNATGHNPSDWIIDKNPTYLEDGARHKECTVCKTVLSTESTPMLDDISSPEIEIKVKDNSFKSFINNISFGLFFKETVDVNITAQDAESGVEKVEYIKTNTPISESDIALQTEWISGDSITVSEDEEFIIYVKVTDKQGNISYVGTDGMVVDKTVPVINGIDDNAVYCQPATFTVSDKYIEKVLINGSEALSDAGEYTLSSDDSQYKIVAIDKAGNETIYNVTVNDGHTYSDWVIDNPADCINSGEKHRLCSICGYEQREVIAALGHNYSDTFTVDVEPTCTTEGEKSKHCSRCDERADITVVDALGHSFGEWKTIVSPDCTNSGSKQRECSDCGFIETENLNPNGHSWNSDYTIDIPATCTEEGSKSIHCANCDAVKDSQVIPANGHKLGEYKVIEAATCTENGLEKSVCSNCDYSETREITASGHDYSDEFTVDKAATCTENGEKSKHCSRCDSKADITVIAPTGHSFELTKTIKPSCTEAGKETYTCKNDSSHTKEVVLSATGHNLSDWIIDKNPTYLEDGARHKECTVCKTVLSTESIPMLDDISAPEIEIKVKDNSFKSFINNISFGLFFKETVDVNITAQDAESGVEKVEYIKTNTPISESDIALQTGWISGDSITVSEDEEFIIYVKATDKQGNISYVGTDGMVVDKTVPVINGIDDNAVYCQPVTFTVSDKYIEKVHINGSEALSDSGEYTLVPDKSAYKVVAVDKASNETIYNVTVNDGHTYGAWVIDNPADCTNSGEKHRVCSICGYEQREVIAALGHNYSDTFTVDVEPTCTTEGEKSKHCSRCDSKAKVTVIAPTGHSYGEWTVVTEPTCTEKGTQQKVCTFCDSIEAKEIAATGHSWNNDYSADVEPTCTTEGSKSIHCANCSETKDPVVIPPTGHHGGTANCHSGAICEACGTEYGEIDLSNHDGNIEIKGYIAPTVNDFGYTGDVYCKSCGTMLESGTQIDKLPPETTEPTKPDDTTNPTEKPTDKTETTTADSFDNVNKNISKTSPATGNTIALPVALSTALALGLICFGKKKKED